MTSHTAQAVERKNFIDSLDTMIWADDAEQKLRARGDALIAYDARAGYRTAEQGADVLPRYLFGLAGMKEDAAGPWTPYPLASIAIGNAVAAATRAAIEKAAQAVDDRRKAVKNSETARHLQLARDDIRSLADALPAEAPEGREADRMADPNYYPPSSGDHPFARWFTDYQQRAGLDAAQATSAYYTGVSAWRAALGVIAASPEAAQPAASERDICAFETLLGNLEDEVNAIGSVLGSSVRMRAAHKAVVARYEAALAQAVDGKETR